MVYEDVNTKTTCYLIYYIDPDSKEKKLVGYTRNKNLLKLYLDFHNCKDMKVKPISATLGEINKILDNHVTCNICMKSLSTRDPDSPHKTIEVLVPLTSDEYLMMQGCRDAFVIDNQCGYRFILQLMSFFKDKYSDALNNIYLGDIAKRIENMKYNEKVDQIDIDEVMLLIKSNRHLFE